MLLSAICAARYKGGVIDEGHVRYTIKAFKYEKRWTLCLAFGLLAMLAGCTRLPGTLDRLGGGHAQNNRPPPPGLDEPYGNLASVPKRPPPLPATMRQLIRARLEAANAHQNKLPAPAGTTATTMMTTPSPARRIAPVLLAFAHGSAIIHVQNKAKIVSVAAGRGDHAVLAAGFAAGRTATSLHLALLRATAIANALTLDGVPPSAIRLAALTGPRGGAVEVIYKRKLESGMPHEDKR